MKTEHGGFDEREVPDLEIRVDGWLVPEDRAGVAAVLRQQAWWATGETIDSVEAAGEGNMNLTLRIQSTQGSIILKQARPWVQKYPQIPAPVDRHDHERHFYEKVNSDECLAGRMPKLVSSMPSRAILFLEDLTPAKDLSWQYKAPDRAVLLTALDRLLPWLARLHDSPLSENERAMFENRRLRTLNAEHLFVVPFLERSVVDLDAITPGLASLRERWIGNDELHSVLNDYHRRYMVGGPRLLHGDFFPGSWLHDDRAFWVIDPEFCFAGPPEFDLGVMLGHLRMIDPDSDWKEQVCDVYPLDRLEINWAEVERWAGIEVLRRLFGVAQLPLRLGIEEKTRLVELAMWSLVAAAK